MNQYQLIALDMDGTLLNSKKEISPGCKAAIEKALAAGKDVVLSTGRCRPELTEFRELIPGLRYVNCTSGAMGDLFQHHGYPHCQRNFPPGTEGRSYAAHSG